MRRPFLLRGRDGGAEPPFHAIFKPLLSNMMRCLSQGSSLALALPLRRSNIPTPPKDPEPWPPEGRTRSQPLRSTRRRTRNPRRPCSASSSRTCARTGRSCAKGGRAANRIANTVAVGFVQERERIIRQQQEAIRELSTPVLQVRERLLILPIIGVIDPQRARQLTEQLLRAIRTNRAKVVVIDITGVAAMDSNVANHLVQTVEASRLLGATVIVTGLSPEIAQTLVTIGVDLSEMATVGDLQGGIEEAERLLGYKVVPQEELAPKA